jgi:predicted P-loop ATPase
MAVEQLLRTEKGAIRPCEYNARELINAAPQYADLHYDDFLARLRIGERDWGDADDLDALCWLQSVHRVPGFTKRQVQNAVQGIAYSRRRDSLWEFVSSLAPWDGAPRIEMAFVDAWGATDDALTRAASMNFFVALIARALSPGAQVDTVWVIEGPQGTYKSRSLRALGGEFHAEITAPMGSADFMRELRGVWIAEMSELDSLRGREASTVKRLLSAPADRFVQKYALHAESYRRRAVAVATTNESVYWQDSTGARRLVPIRCGTIRVDLIEVNRVQWFAEALALYRKQATWWEFPTSIEAAREERQSIDPWEDVLREMIAHGRPADSAGMSRIPWSEEPISSAEIMRDWLQLEPHQQGQAVSKRLGHVMRRLGFAPVRIGHEGTRGWHRADTSGQPRAQVSA